MSRVIRITALTTALAAALGGAARGQDRPFVFSIATATDTSTPALRVDFDFGAGESMFRSSQSEGPEQRVGLQVSADRFTFIGRFGIATDTEDSYQSWQEGDVLYSVTSGRAPVRLAVGGGVLREVDGTNVFLAHVIAAHDTEFTRTNANLRLEHAAAPGRDAVDVIVSGGWARMLGRGVSVGVEGLGEDLEGFWDPTEAEGGSRILVGPTLHLAPDGHKWQLSTVGGPTFHPDATSRTTDAVRELPPGTARVGYAVQVTFAIAVF